MQQNWDTHHFECWLCYVLLRKVGAPDLWFLLELSRQ